MAKRRLFDFSTAYAQLILLVFLPISALALVGAVLVLRETTHASRIEQQAKADTALTRYETASLSIKNSLWQIQNSFSSDDTTNNKKSQKSAKKTLSTQELVELQRNLKSIFQNVPQDRHILGMAIVNEQGQVLASTGNMANDSNHLYANSNHLKSWQLPGFVQSLLGKMGYNIAEEEGYDNPNFVPILENLIQTQDIAVGNELNVADKTTSAVNPSIASKDGMIYGKKLNLNEDYANNFDNSTTASMPIAPVWLLVNVDDEPLQLARLQVLFALAVTGLFTILLLLLSLNVYARRWIAPIYEMRLHLQRTNATNLYKPMSFTSSGEINQLQQDMTKTLRRLHTSFQELKNHAEQTEDDLRLAFDEMEMQNISIRNARDAAVSASQTKSAFLANISHELRTPLNSIDGFINLLARHSGLSDEQNLYVQTIRKSSAHLLALVNDVLDFSKIEAGKLVLDKHEFDLYASIYDVVDMLSPLAAEKQLNVAVFFYDDVPRYLVGDALRVKQVLTNLVNNAIKFTDVGEVVVRVSLDENHDDRLMISVQDTGKGVSPEQQGLLFQSFSQGDPSITRQYGGTGLGLVISKQLTQLMGGKIGYEANPSDEYSTGSMFWFTLPITLSHTQQQVLTETSMWELPNFTGLMNKWNDGKMHLLVWINHTASRQVLKGSVNQLPIVVTFVQSLAEMLPALQDKSKRWDWIIVDNESLTQAAALLKQIRLYYAGKLAVFGYQLNLDPELLNRYQAKPLYQPLDRRQLYQLLGDDNPQQIEKTSPQWQGFRVLAVDDHLPNLLVLEALLAELGIEVVTANSGFEAIDYIAQSQSNPDTAIDLIFMDIQMPKMSGQEAATEIRQIEQDQSQLTPVPIIALTAHSLSDEKASLLASGIDDYVGKPISQAQLLQILQRWLGKNSLAEQSTPLVTDTTFAKPPSVHNVKHNPQNTNHMPQSLLPKLNETANEVKNDNNLTDVNNENESEKIDRQKSDLPVIDWDDALMRAAGKAELASNLMMLLIDSIDQEKADLEQAWQTQDRQALANIAHRILGASRYTGVPALRQASQDFEDKCLLNVQNASPAQFVMLAPWYEQLLAALDTLQHTDLTPWSQLYYARLKEQDMPWKMM